MSDSLTSMLRSGFESQTYTTAAAAIVSRNPPHIRLTSFPNGENVSNIYFDIASLTKLFTTAALLRYVDRKIISLDAPLSTYLDEMKKSLSGSATVEQTLRHTAGFPPWHPFYEEVPLSERGSSSAKERIFQKAIRIPPQMPPGALVQYSDIGYIILGYLLERVGQKSLQAIINEEISVPLALSSVHYRPVHTPSKGEYAPTEQCPWRGQRLVGTVHDDNAWCMGGIAGHAGLFATAADIAEFGAAWLDAAESSTWLSQNLAQKASRPHPCKRGLGWDFKSEPNSSAGDRISSNAFGHLGFTGCSLWVDPEQKCAYALLTNRVYFGRDNDKIRQYRPYFFNGAIRLFEQGMLF